MAARRCSICCINWPTDVGYMSCPSCDEKTAWLSNDEAIPKDEAESTKKRLAFERFYEERGPRAVEVDFSYLDEIVALESIPVDGEEIPVPPLPPPETWGRDSHLLRSDGTL